MKSDPNNPLSFSAKARKSRIHLFSSLVQSLKLSQVTILDIGGTINYWKMNLPYIPSGIIKRIDVVNLVTKEERIEDISGVQLYSYAGDALRMDTLKLKHYDIIHSNSVIEHVGNLQSQRLMASLIINQGRHYFIQTPARSFIIEPHFYFPLFPYLPLSFRTFLHMHFDLGYMKKNANWIEARIACENTRLLTKKEFSSIFTNGSILTERFFLLSKSYIATNMK